MKTLHKDFTGANRGNGEGKPSLCSLRSLLFKSGPGDFLVCHDDGVNIYAKRDADADFVFLAATPPRPT